MARRRDALRVGARDELIEDEERLYAMAVKLGATQDAERTTERLRALCADEPVTVLHGYEIGLRDPYSGPWLLHSDGSLQEAM